MSVDVNEACIESRGSASQLVTRCTRHARTRTRRAPAGYEIGAMVALGRRCCTTLQEPFGAEQMGQWPVESMHDCKHEWWKW